MAIKLNQIVLYVIKYYCICGCPGSIYECWETPFRFSGNPKLNQNYNETIQKLVAKNATT